MQISQLNTKRQIIKKIYSPTVFYKKRIVNVETDALSKEGINLIL